MTDRKPKIAELKLYTGLYGGDEERPPVIVWVTVEGDVFLGCTCKMPTPLTFIDNALQCSECKRVISLQSAKDELLIVLEQVAALYGLFCVPTDWAVVETKTAWPVGKREETDNEGQTTV